MRRLGSDIATNARILTTNAKKIATNARIIRLMISKHYIIRGKNFLDSNIFIRAFVANYPKR